MTMHISDKFLKFIQSGPPVITREFRQTGSYPHHKFYVVNMKWEVDRSTVNIIFRDTGSFSYDSDTNLWLLEIKLTKKKFYGLYTDKTSISRFSLDNGVAEKLEKMLINHYTSISEDAWEITVNPAIDKYL
jgi:hypothetical protein